MNSLTRTFLFLFSENKNETMFSSLHSVEHNSKVIILDRESVLNAHAPAFIHKCN